MGKPVHPDLIGGIAILDLLEGKPVCLNLLVRAKIIDYSNLRRLIADTTAVKGIDFDEAEEKIDGLLNTSIKLPETKSRR